MIVINPKDLALVKDILTKHLNGYEVRAFGSRVMGKPKPHSDLDLVIMSQSPISLVKMGDLREAFENSDVSITVDCIDWAAISDEFRAVINQKYEVL